MTPSRTFIAIGASDNEMYKSWFYETRLKGLGSSNCLVERGSTTLGLENKITESRAHITKPDKCTEKYFLYFFKVWVEKPTINDIESMTSPIEELAFPAVTLCPKNPNPDRWGPTIKLFDHLRLSCKHG